MAFSFAKYNESLSKASVKKLLKRGVLIFLVGLGLNAFPFYPTSPDPQQLFSRGGVCFPSLRFGRRVAINSIPLAELLKWTILN